MRLGVTGSCSMIIIIVSRKFYQPGSPKKPQQPCLRASVQCELIKEAAHKHKHKHTQAHKWAERYLQLVIAFVEPLLVPMRLGVIGSCSMIYIIIVSRKFYPALPRYQPGNPKKPQQPYQTQTWRSKQAYMKQSLVGPVPRAYLNDIQVWSKYVNIHAQSASQGSLGVCLQENFTF